MAYLRYKDGSQKIVAETEAEKLWRILVGQAKPLNTAQKQYCEQIRRELKTVVLNYRTAPEEYVRANMQRILPMILSDWAVDRRGNPKHPANASQWAFAKKYGLWKGRKASPIVTGGQMTIL